MSKLKAFLRRVWGFAPRRHIALAAGLLLLLLTRAVYRNKAAANFVVTQLTGPLERWLGRLCGLVPFSVAELFWAVLILAVLAATVYTVRRLFCPNPARALWQYFMTLAVGGVFLYAGFCLLWGVNYYADSFSDQSGLAAAPVSTAQLQTAAAFFAKKVNETAPLVARSDSGEAVFDNTALLADSVQVYTPLEEEYPFLTAPALQPKPLALSRLVSLLDFTGFYFPFTGEANINMDFPAALRPFTIAHELAHQRTIASEQEANFVGIRAAVTSGLPAYEYSGYLAGYLYLGNALYEADYEAWAAINETLCSEALADFKANNVYWAQFQNKPISGVSNGVYDSFLKSYNQQLGRKSYGACVDLLCAYYAPEQAG